MKTRIILASSSGVKNLIMQKSHLEYEALSPDIDENQFDDTEIVERVRMISEAKARVVVNQSRYSDAFIIAADTLTQDVSNKKEFTKPESVASQYREVLLLSGGSIDIYTGISIYYKGEVLESTTTHTTVTYQEFDENTIKRLAQSDNPTIRSSALGMFTDALGFTLVENVEGSYTGAFGLPMEVVYRNLNKIKDK